MPRVNDICLWDDGISTKRVLVLEGPKRAAAFRCQPCLGRIDSYAMIAKLDSGKTAIVQCDDIVPIRIGERAAPAAR